MYGKIFASLFTGSMRGKGDLQLVFTYMISNATEEGICDFTPQCISDATGKPIDLIERCLTELESPDEMSRTRSDDGRRIRKLDPSRPWGWHIINYQMYRSIATREAMKEAERLRKRDYRMRTSGQCPGQIRDNTGPSAYDNASDYSEEDKSVREGVKRFVPPTPEEVDEYSKAIGYPMDGSAWCDKYIQKGWMVGKNKMKDWKAAVRNWKSNGWLPDKPNLQPSFQDRETERKRRLREVARQCGKGSNEQPLE